MPQKRKFDPGATYTKPKFDPNAEYGTQAAEKEIKPSVSASAATGLSAAPKRSWWQQGKDVLFEPPTAYGGTLDAPGRSPAEVAGELGKGAAFAVPTGLAVMNPVATARGVVGSVIGSGAGGWLGHEAGLPFGAEETGRKVGGVVGGLAGGIAGTMGWKPTVHGKWGVLRDMLKKEPAAVLKSAEQAAVAESEAAPSAILTASEGRPATWTNQRVLELAKRGNQDAIEQARLRRLTFPGMRYITGEGSPFEKNVFALRERLMRPLVKGTGEEGVLRVGGPRNVAAARASGLVGRATETAKDLGYGLTNPQAPRELRQIGQNFRAVTGSPDRILVGQLERRGLNIPKKVSPSMMDEMEMLVEELPADLTLRQRRLVDTTLNRQYADESEIFDAVTKLRENLGLGAK